MSEVLEMFERATKLKVRFEYKGQIAVEDLWDLSLDALDKIYRSLLSSLKGSEEGLLNTRKAEDKIIDLKIEIVKYVFAEKKKEMEEVKLASDKRAKKKYLLEVLERKQNAQLESLSPEELTNMINEL